MGLTYGIYRITASNHNISSSWILRDSPSLSFLFCWTITAENNEKVRLCWVINCGNLVDSGRQQIHSLLLLSPSEIIDLTQSLFVFFPVVN